MIDYPKIDDLIKRFPDDAWGLLEKLNQCHPSMLVCELLAKRPKPQRTERPLPGTRLANHPDNPRPR
jgi:hypothetical protein